VIVLRQHLGFKRTLNKPQRVAPLVRNADKQWTKH